MGKILPEQRLSTGQSDLVGAHSSEQASQPSQLLEGEDGFPWQPDVLLLGHAVLAPEIAPIGDGEPEAAEGTAKEVDHGK
jgi:hypothetical protein